MGLGISGSGGSDAPRPRRPPPDLPSAAEVRDRLSDAHVFTTGRPPLVTTPTPASQKAHTWAVRELGKIVISEASARIGAEAAGAVRGALDRSHPATMDVGVDQAADAIEALPQQLGEHAGRGIWDVVTDPSGPVALAVPEPLREPVGDLLGHVVAGLTESMLAGPVGAVTTGLRLAVVGWRLSTQPASLADSACARSLLEDAAAQYISDTTRDILTAALDPPEPQEPTPGPQPRPASTAVTQRRPAALPPVDVNLGSAHLIEPRTQGRRLYPAEFSQVPPAAAEPPPVMPEPPPPPRDRRRLADLDRLHDAGLVTDEEYEQIKQRILG